MRKGIFFCAGLMLALTALSGCVRRSDYDRDVNDLERKLRQERIINAANLKDLELKLRDKSRSVNELTQRYMELQETAAGLKAWKAGFDKELSALSADVDELRLIFTKNAANIKGPAPFALHTKMVDIETRLNALMKLREAEAVQPRAVTPAQ